MPQKKSAQFPCNAPESGKNTPQPKAKGPLPEHSAGEHPGQIPRPQISRTDAEPEVNAGREEDEDKQSVCQEGSPGPQRPQKIVAQAQSGTVYKTPQKPDPGG